MELLYEWFGVVGLPTLDIVDMQTLIPYLLNVVIALAVTALVFRTVVQIAKLFTEWRWR